MSSLTPSERAVDPFGLQKWPLVIKSQCMAGAKFTFAAGLHPDSVLIAGRLIMSHGGIALLDGPRDSPYLVVKGWKGTGIYMHNPPDGTTHLDRDHYIPASCNRVVERKGKDQYCYFSPPEETAWVVTQEWLLTWARTGVRPPRPVMWCIVQDGDKPPKRKNASSTATILKPASAHLEYLGQRNLLGQADPLAWGYAVSSTVSHAVLPQTRMSNTTSRSRPGNREQARYTETSPGPPVIPHHAVRGSAPGPSRPRTETAGRMMPSGLHSSAGPASAPLESHRSDQGNNDMSRVQPAKHSSIPIFGTAQLSLGSFGQGIPHNMKRKQNTPSSTSARSAKPESSIPSSSLRTSLPPTSAAAGPSGLPAVEEEDPRPVKRSRAEEGTTALPTTNSSATQVKAPDSASVDSGSRDRLLPTGMSLRRWLRDHHMTIHLGGSLGQDRSVWDKLKAFGITPLNEPEKATLIVLDIDDPQLDDLFESYRSLLADREMPGRIVTSYWLDACFAKECYQNAEPFDMGKNLETIRNGGRASK